MEPSLVAGIAEVGTDDAQEMARRLSSEEGLFAGTSSGANAIAAIQVAERLGPAATVVTLIAGAVATPVIDATDPSGMVETKQVSVKVGQLLAGGNTGKVWPFLKALGITVDENTPAGVLATHARTVAARAVADGAFRSRYVAEAKKQGLM